MTDYRAVIRAGGAVAYAIRKGALPHPTTLPCAFCGGPAVEYHHWIDYAPEHWLDVKATCRRCHRKDDLRRARDEYWTEWERQAGKRRPHEVDELRPALGPME